MEWTNNPNIVVDLLERSPDHASTRMMKKSHELSSFAFARFGWVLCLGLAMLGAVLLAWAQCAFQDSAFGLVGTQKFYAMESSLRYRFELLAARAQWVAMATLMVSAGSGALVFTALTLRRLFTFHDLLHCGFALPLLAGPVVFYCYAVGVLRPLPEGQADGFLSLLVASIGEAERHSVHKEVMATRLVGEGAAVGLALTAAALATFNRIIHAADLASRFQVFRNALYASSLLLVTGVMMCRANFSWIVAHWDVTDPGTLNAISGVVTAGVVQAGAGYSALLLCAFGPCRILLESKLHTSMSVSERTGWQTDYKLETGWRAEAQQVFAILAPALSAPIFDAAARL